MPTWFVVCAIVFVIWVVGLPGAGFLFTRLETDRAKTMQESFDLLPVLFFTLLWPIALADFLIYALKHRFSETRAI